MWCTFQVDANNHASTLCPDKKWTPRLRYTGAVFKTLNAQYCSAISKEMRKLLHEVM